MADKVEKVEMVRVNTRVSSPLNDWLDKRSLETGMSKSTLVMLALENYRQQVEVVDSLPTMVQIMEKLERIEESLSSGK